jgi:hypothetical protein
MKNYNIVNNKQEDGYVFSKILDEENNNYLTYMYSPMNGWKTVNGKVDGYEFKGIKTLTHLWQRKGRGKQPSKHGTNCKICTIIFGKGRYKK